MDLKKIIREIKETNLKTLFIANVDSESAGENTEAIITPIGWTYKQWFDKIHEEWIKDGDRTFYEGRPSIKLFNNEKGQEEAVEHQVQLKNITKSLTDAFNSKTRIVKNFNGQMEEVSVPNPGVF